MFPKSDNSSLSRIRMARDVSAMTSLALSAGLFLSPTKATKRTILRHDLCDSRMVRDYLIIYAPDEKPLAVTAVLHGRRNPRIIAAILRLRR
jgi:hypothetical protein